jgi:hypothetical protein
MAWRTLVLRATSLAASTARHVVAPVPAAVHSRASGLVVSSHIGLRCLSALPPITEEELVRPHPRHPCTVITEQAPFVPARGRQGRAASCSELIQSCVCEGVHAVVFFPSTSSTSPPSPLCSASPLCCARSWMPLMCGCRICQARVVHPPLLLAYCGEDSRCPAACRTLSLHASQPQATGPLSPRRPRPTDLSPPAPAHACAHTHSMAAKVVSLLLVKACLPRADGPLRWPPPFFVFGVWFDLVWFGLVWFGLVWFGLVWFGLVWFGMVWFGLCRRLRDHVQHHRGVTALRWQTPCGAAQARGPLARVCAAAW